jgi:environmental stress-induced protein Ves
VKGPVRDFNVFVRRRDCSADVSVLRLSRAHVTVTPSFGDALVHVVEGRVTARAAAPGGEAAGAWSLGAGDSLLGRNLGPGWAVELAGDPGSSAIVVGIEPRAR